MSYGKITWRKTHAILLLVAFTAALCCCLSGPQPTGKAYGTINTSNDPNEVDYPQPPMTTITKGDNTFNLSIKANYTASVVVESKKIYYSGWEAELAPIDLLFLWGNLTDPAMDEYISYRQDSRKYFFEYARDTPVSRDYIQGHSANTHVIPATDNIYQILKTLGNGEEAVLEGNLVDAEGAVDGRKVWWRTSMLRSDGGSGSCELFYVKKVRVGNDVYE